ncbi:MAG: hypothetical protein WCR55_02795 [Lentisphaerota bacterium]
MNKDKILSLISLLDDENENTASFAIRELLAEGREVQSSLAEHQESSNNLLRKRIHQLQAINSIKKSRDILSRRFSNKHSSIWNGMLEVHLAWFDKDTKENINILFCELLKEFSQKNTITPATIANFMRSMGFVMPIDGDIDPEYYCMGPVLESKIGSDALLSTIAYKLLIESGVITKLVQYKNLVCLLYRPEIVISPNTWKLEPANISDYQEIEPGKLLRHTMLQLFLASTCSENYRYSFTIGKCLKKAKAPSKNKVL